MSYYLYTTEGVILSSSLAAESSRFYHIYTEELGLVGVWGQGVRKLGSKLRGNLQDFSHVRISLIKGKSMWRLTDVENIATFNDVLASAEKRMFVARISALLKRLLEEGADPILFNFFVDTLRYVETNTFDKKNLESLEVIFVLRVLHHLGYVKKDAVNEFFLSQEWNEEILQQGINKKYALLKEVNVSLGETHL
jgi:DNA repair protein RecO (recombination protein O)